jgi:hypothetical protein
MSKSKRTFLLRLEDMHLVIRLVADHRISNQVIEHFSATFTPSVAS